MLIIVYKRFNFRTIPGTQIKIIEKRQLNHSNKSITKSYSKNNHYREHTVIYLCLDVNFTQTRQDSQIIVSTTNIIERYLQTLLDHGKLLGERLNFYSLSFRWQSTKLNLQKTISKLLASGF